MKKKKNQIVSCPNNKAKPLQKIYWDINATVSPMPERCYSQFTAPGNEGFGAPKQLYPIACEFNEVLRLFPYCSQGETDHRIKRCLFFFPWHKIASTVILKRAVHSWLSVDWTWAINTQWAIPREELRLCSFFYLTTRQVTTVLSILLYKSYDIKYGIRQKLIYAALEAAFAVAASKLWNKQSLHLRHGSSLTFWQLLVKPNSFSSLLILCKGADLMYFFIRSLIW